MAGHESIAWYSNVTGIGRETIARKLRTLEYKEGARGAGTPYYYQAAGDLIGAAAGAYANRKDAKGMIHLVASGCDPPVHAFCKRRRL